MKCGLRGSTRGSECNEGDIANESGQRPVRVGRPHTTLPSINIPKSNIFYKRKLISATSGRKKRKKNKSEHKRLLGERRRRKQEIRQQRRRKKHVGSWQQQNNGAGQQQQQGTGEQKQKGHRGQQQSTDKQGHNKYDKKKGQQQRAGRYQASQAAKSFEAQYEQFDTGKRKFKKRLEASDEELIQYVTE